MYVYVLCTWVKGFSTVLAFYHTVPHRAVLGSEAAFVGDGVCVCVQLSPVYKQC